MVDCTPLVTRSFPAIKKQLHDRYKDCAKKAGESLGHARNLENIAQFLRDIGLDFKIAFIRFPDGIHCTDDEFQGHVAKSSEVRRPIVTHLVYVKEDIEVKDLNIRVTETQFNAVFLLRVDEQMPKFRKPKKQQAAFKDLSGICG